MCCFAFFFKLCCSGKTQCTRSVASLLVLVFSCICSSAEERKMPPNDFQGKHMKIYSSNSSLSPTMNETERERERCPRPRSRIATRSSGAVARDKRRRRAQRSTKNDRSRRVEGTERRFYSRLERGRLSRAETNSLSLADIARRIDEQTSVVGEHM